MAKIVYKIICVLVLSQISYIIGAQTKRASWWTEPHRFLQFNLQVKDADLIDADEVIRYAKEELRAEAIMLNAGGIYAWYPTEVPFHQKNPYMGDRDVFGELVEAAKKYDIKILARTDWSKTTEKTFEDHPEWFALKPDGKPQITGEPRFGDYDMLYLTCGAGPYRNEAVAMPALKEIITKYDVDAFFFSFAKFNTSYSPYAKKKYKSLYGKDLAEEKKDINPNWLSEAYYDTWKNWYKAIKETDPQIAIVGRTRMDQRETIELMSEFSDVLSTQPRDAYFQGWEAQDPRWKSSIETNFARSAHQNGERPLILTNTAPGLAWRHTSLPKAEFDFWMAQIIANGGNWLPSTTGFPAVMEDQRTLENVRDFNLQIEKIQPYLANNFKNAPVAILNSKSNFKKSEDELNGFFEAMISHQIQFDVISEYNLIRGDLKNYDLLILADQRILTDQEITAINDFIEKGGKTLSTFQTGLYTDREKKRDNFFLKEYLEIEDQFDPLQDQTGSYLRIENPAHPLLQKLGNTLLIPNGKDIMIVSSSREPLVTLVPPFAPDGWFGNPPERARFRKESTEVSILHSIRDHIYFANQIGQLTWDYRLPDHKQLIANAINSLVPEASPLHTINYPDIMVTPFKKDRGHLLFFVNNVGERPLRQTNTLKDVEVVFDLNKKPGKVESLINEQDIGFTYQDNKLSFTLPILHTWEAVYIE